MQITKIEDQTNWEEIIAKLPKPCFLQSSNWGVFQQQLGSKVIRLLVEDGPENLLAAQYYLKKSRFFSFLYCPRGPMTNSANLLPTFIDALIADAKELKADFVLVEPEGSDEFITKLKTNIFLPTQSMQPEQTSILALSRLDNETLFSNLRKTTRQMIRKAQENQVIIKTYTDLNHWDKFVEVFTETTQRQKFNPHSIGYMKQQLQIFAKDNQAKLYLAEINNQAVAGAIILSYNQTSTYLHAASISEGRKIGAAQLLVWTAIQDAKAKGDTTFDFWGIAPDDNPNHPWAGITIFKTGFAGETVSYPGAFVLPVNANRYQLYRFITRLRRAPVFKIIQRNLLSKITKG